MDPVDVGVVTPARLKALQEARKFVSALLQETNDKGYQKYTMKAADRITLELQVAGWLLGEPSDYC